MQVRTTNLLERLFVENWQRVKVSPHFLKQGAGLKLVYAAILATSRKSLGVKINPLVVPEIDSL